MADSGCACACAGAKDAAEAVKPEQVAGQVEQAGKLAEGKYTSPLTNFTKFNNKNKTLLIFTCGTSRSCRWHALRV